MRVLCRHGYYAFYPKTAAEVSRFSSFYGTSLVRSGDHYTFPGLADLPRYSIQGGLYGGLPAIKTFAGHPWEVMEANGLVWSLALSALAPAATQMAVTYPMPNMGYYFAPRVQGLPQAGALVGTSPVLSFDAMIEPDMTVRVIEFSAVDAGPTRIMLDATCEAGVVTADGVPVPGAQILSEGVGASSGVLLIDEDRARYVAKTSPDLKTTLEKLIVALDKTVAALQAIDGVGSLVTSCGAGAGSATWIPVAASDISGITSAKADLEALMEELK